MSVGFGEEDAARARGAGFDAGAGRGVALVGDAPDGGLGLLLDPLFRLGGAVPVGAHEAALVQGCEELVPRVGDVGVLAHAVVDARREGALDVVELLADVGGEAVERHEIFRLRVATGELAGALLEVARSHGDAQGHALEFVLGELPSAPLRVVVVELDANAGRLELVSDRLALGDDLFHLVWPLVDGHNDDFNGGELGRKHEALVVAVGHDEGANESGADAPRRSPNVRLPPLLVRERHVERLGEVLAQEVGGAGLQGFAVLHERLDAVRVLGAREALALGLHALDDGHRHEVLREVGVDLEHLLGFFDGLVLGRVGRVAFLPEEFCGAQEQARAHLPAHHVGPLVHEEGKVAVALDPALVGVPDDGFGGGANDEFFLEFGVGVDHHSPSVGVVLQTVMRHHRALLGEALHMRRFLAQVALGDEQREVGVDVARVLEHAVKHVLHPFPNRKPVRLDDHAPLHVAVLGEVRLHNELVVPFAVVFFAGSELAGHFWYGLCGRGQ